MLSDIGAALWAVTRDPHRLEMKFDAAGIKARCIAGDLLIPSGFSKAYSRCKPALTFNLAAYGIASWERDHAQMEVLNREVPERVAETIGNDVVSFDWPGPRLVHAGSAFEYGALSGRLTEDRSPVPSNDYGDSKLAGTNAVLAVSRSQSLTVTIARMATVYGPGERPDRLLPSLMSAAKTGSRLELTSGSQTRDFTWVADAAEGLLRLGAAPKAATVSGIVNLATGKLTTVRSFVHSAAEVLSLSPEQLRVGALPQREDEVRQGPLDIQRLHDLVNWAPTTTIRAGITMTRDFPASLKRVFHAHP